MLTDNKQKQRIQSFFVNRGLVGSVGHTLWSYCTASRVPQLRWAALSSYWLTSSWWWREGFILSLLMEDGILSHVTLRPFWCLKHVEFPVRNITSSVLPTVSIQQQTGPNTSRKNKCHRMMQKDFYISIWKSVLTCRFIISSMSIVTLPNVK